MQIEFRVRIRRAEIKAGANMTFKRAHAVICMQSLWRLKATVTMLSELIVIARKGCPCMKRNRATLKRVDARVD